MRFRQRRYVDLPQPEGPMSAVTVPAYLDLLLLFALHNSFISLLLWDSSVNPQLVCPNYITLTSNIPS